MLVQRIVMGREFIDDVNDQAGLFIKLVTLPELVGKWFTKLNVTVKEEETSQESDQENKDRWRYCRRVW